MACEPCQEINPCSQCGCTEECNCETPVYTNVTCPNGVIQSGCVISAAETDACVGITKNTSTLTQVINAIVTYIKNARNRILPADNSITLLPIDDSCDDKISIKVKIDPDVNNNLELRSNGLFVDLNNSDLNLTCNDISPIFSGAVGQQNTINPSSYGFLSTGDSGCAKILAPTGFAVTGNTRKSAFGKMEWFNNLTSANDAATSGETVLIYNDTNEDLLTKSNVNYEGIGIHVIGNLTINNTSGVSNIAIKNLIVQNLLCSGNDNVEATNIRISGISSINNNMKWSGGIFLDPAHPLLIQGNASVTKIYSEKSIELQENALLSDTVIYDRSNFTNGYFALSLSGSDGNMAVATNCVIKSINNVGVYSIGRTSISHLDITTGTKTALFIHGGNMSTVSELSASHIVARNTGPDEAVLIYNTAQFSPTPTNNVSFASITNISGFSTTGVGIRSVLSTIHKSYGSSVENYGIFIDSQENKGFNLGIIECVGISKKLSGIRANRDIFIVGGTYISGLDTVNGNPILLSSISQNGTTPNNYYIAGVKTIATSTSAYGIKAIDPITAKITGNIFLNEKVLGSTLGIDLTNITLIPVTFDAYGNIS